VKTAAEVEQRRAQAAEEVLTLDFNMPVGEALRRLSDRHVLSAPVLDYSAGLVYKGIVSVTDMVLDLTSRHSAEKDLLLHQLGTATCVSIPPSTILLIVDHR